MAHHTRVYERTSTLPKQQRQWTRWELSTSGQAEEEMRVVSRRCAVELSSLGCLVRGTRYKKEWERSLLPPLPPTLPPPIGSPSWEPSTASGPEEEKIELQLQAPRRGNVRCCLLALIDSRSERTTRGIGHKREPASTLREPTRHSRNPSRDRQTSTGVQFQSSHLN